MVVSLLLAVPAVVGLWLVTGGRTSRSTSSESPPRPSPLHDRAAGRRRSVPARSRPGLAARARRALVVRRRRHRRAPGAPDRGHRCARHRARVGRRARRGRPATFLGCLLHRRGRRAGDLHRPGRRPLLRRFELVLVPMWLLISRYGDRHDETARTDAGHRFVLYTAVGSTLMLVGILTLVTSAGTSTCVRWPPGPGRRCPPTASCSSALPVVVGLVGQGPGLPPAHLAPAGAHDGADRRLGAARRGAAQDGHLRLGPTPGGERARRLRAARPGARPSPG